MSKEKSLQSSPQLVFEEQQGVAVAPSQKQIVSLYKKAESSGHSFDTLLEVYRRGFVASGDERGAFSRVNSFIAEGKAYEMDKDLVEKRGLWDNIHAKRERIKHGSGEHMRKPGSKGAPTDASIRDSQTEDADPCWTNYKQVGMKMKNGKQVPNCVPEAANAAQQAAIAIAMKKAGKKPHNEGYTGAEKVSSNPNEPANRFIGTDALTNNYKSSTPGQSKIETIKKVVREQLEEQYYPCDNCTCGFAEEYIAERGADAKGYYRSTESGAGLTAKGAKHFGIQTAVTEKNPKGKRAARRRSFCARMSGMKGPMKDEKGRPTRKAMSLRRWNCR